MGCNKCECTVWGLIVSALAGIALGILFSLGFVSTGVIFWAYLAISVASFFVAPLYAGLTEGREEQCFCGMRRGFLLVAIGAAVTSVVGLIVRFVASTLLVSIIVGLSTFFAVLLLSLLACLTVNLCRR